MRTQTAVIAVVGHKNSGKTAVIEIIVKELTNRGYKVSTAKHVNQKAFSVDTKGKDTWRHSAAGANPVLSVSDIETAVLIRDGARRLSLEWMLSLTSETDVVMIEGFSWLIMKNEHVGKIVCIRNNEEYEDFKRRIERDVIAYCSIHPMEQPILRIGEDAQILAERAVKYVERKQKILEIIRRLPRLNCGKCGHSTCEEMAVAIYANKAKFNDCFTLKLRPKLKTLVIVNDTEIPLQPFVSEIIRKSLLGMVSSLKGISIKGNEEVNIKLSSPEKRSSEA